MLWRSEDSVAQVIRLLSDTHNHFRRNLSAKLIRTCTHTLLDRHRWVETFLFVHMLYLCYFCWFVCLCNIIATVERGAIFICSYFVLMLFLLVCLSNFIAIVEVAINPKKLFPSFFCLIFCCFLEERKYKRLGSIFQALCLHSLPWYTGSCSDCGHTRFVTLSLFCSSLLLFYSLAPSLLSWVAVAGAWGRCCRLLHARPV